MLFRAPIAGQGRPVVAVDQDHLNLLPRPMLCRPMRLVVVMPQHLATHPEDPGRGVDVRRLDDAPKGGGAAASLRG